MMAVHNMLIVGEPTNGPFLAQRFNDQFVKLLDELADDIPDDPEAIAILEITLDNGLPLRKFQKHIIETFDAFANAMYDDDLVQELIDGHEHPDIHDVIEIVSEFNHNNPGYAVQSLVPVDLKGTFGFIIKADQNGSTQV